MCLLAVGSTPPKQLAIKYDQYEIIVLRVRDNTIRMYELAGCKRGGGSAPSALNVSKCEKVDPFWALKFDFLILKTHFISF